MEQNTPQHQSHIKKSDAQCHQLKLARTSSVMLISLSLLTDKLGRTSMVVSNIMNNQLLMILIQRWDQAQVLVSSTSTETTSEQIIHWQSSDVRSEQLKVKPNSSVSVRSNVSLMKCLFQMRIKMHSQLLFL